MGYIHTVTSTEVELSCEFLPASPWAELVLPQQKGLQPSLGSACLRQWDCAVPGGLSRNSELLAGSLPFLSCAEDTVLLFR